MARELIPSAGALPEGPLMVEVRRELTPGDLARLGEAPVVGVGVLKRLRATHHRQAQLLASGKTHREVAAIVGCTPERLSQLEKDPAFQELVHFYSDQIMVLAMEDGARLRDKILDAAEAAVDEIRDRLDDDEKRAKIPTGELRQIATFGLDRTVAPPKTAVPASTAPLSVTMNFGTPIRREEGRVDVVIEGKVEEESETKD